MSTTELLRRCDSRCSRWLEKKMPGKNECLTRTCIHFISSKLLQSDLFIKTSTSRQCVVGKKVNYCETDDLNSNYLKSWWADLHQVVSLDLCFLKPVWPHSHWNCDTHKYARAGPDLSPPSWPLARLESPYPSRSGILLGCTHSGQWIMLPLQDLLIIILMASCVSSTLSPSRWNLVTSPFCNSSCASA